MLVTWHECFLAVVVSLAVSPPRHLWAHLPRAHKVHHHGPGRGCVGYHRPPRHGPLERTFVLDAAFHTNPIARSGRGCHRPQGRAQD